MARQDVLMEPQSPGSPASPSSPGKPSSPELPDLSPEMPPSDEAPEEPAVNPDRKSSSSSSSSSSRASSAECVFHVDAAEMSTPLVVVAPDAHDAHTDAGAGTDAKLPDDWVSWSEASVPKTVDDDPSSPDGGTVSVAPESQTMAKPAAMEGFNPDRIPASIFQPNTSSSQQEWSIASNESLFSIHGASLSQSDDFYAPSRSQFDYFYDEAMAAGASAERDWKLPPLAEVSEHGGTVPGSAVSDASDGSAAAKFRRHGSVSFGSSSNFSFAFPILAEPSPGKKESMGGYQQLQKEHERSPPTPSDRKSQFEEMTTEEERRQRKTGWCWCEEVCGCCWFACPWSTCCRCCKWRWNCSSCCQWRWNCCSSCQWRWNCCSCSWSCPSLCRCRWCL